VRVLPQHERDIVGGIRGQDDLVAPGAVEPRWRLEGEIRVNFDVWQVDAIETEMECVEVVRVTPEGMIHRLRLVRADAGDLEHTCLHRVELRLERVRSRLNVLCARRYALQLLRGCLAHRGTSTAVPV
jgi:hypothetical protein